MTEQPTQGPFEPYRPGPAGGEQPPPPWATQPSSPQTPYTPGHGYGSGAGQGYGQAPPVHPQAVLIMVLGIISFFFALAGPVAWVLGSRAKKEIEASGGRLGGMSQVMVGYVLGIVMTVLIAVIVVLVVVVFVVVLAVAVAAGT